MTSGVVTLFYDCEDQSPPTPRERSFRHQKEFDNTNHASVELKAFEHVDEIGVDSLR